MTARWLALLALGITLALASLAVPARGGCVQECSTMCGRYEEGECVEETQSCSCDEAAAPAAPYGAIAYGKDSGAFGFAYNQGSVSRADSVALSNCAQHGADCKIAIQLTHSCGAVAAGDGSIVNTGSGASRNAAENAAMSACRVRAGNSCAIQVWTCSP